MKHITNKNTQEILQAAEKQCQKHDLRFTNKRSSVLQLMLLENKPLSAYDIMADYKTQYNQNISAVSVYRMLDFLIQAQLVHKLSSSSQYIVCSHITCHHTHETPQLLICDTCHQVEEIGIGTLLTSELEANIAATGFKLQRQQLELHGVCSSCQNLH